MSNANHGVAFSASVDLNKHGMKGFIPAADGNVRVAFPDGETADIVVKAGVQYSMNIDKIVAAGTGIAGTALY